MSDQRLLLLVLAAIYLSECFVWVGYGAVAVRSLVGRRFRVVDPPTFPGNDRGGWVLLNPLPTGAVFVCRQWPAVLSGDAAGPATGQSVNFTTRPPADVRPVRWADVRDVRHDGDAVTVAGAAFARAADEPAAARLTRLLTELAAPNPDARRRRIDRALAAAFDASIARRRVEMYWRATRLLRPLCGLLFVLLFVVLPIVVALGRFADTILHLLPPMLGCWAGIVVTFVAAHRRLLPNERLERWKAAAVMLFAPTAAIRAPDAISRHVLADADPAAAAAALLDDDRFAAFAGRVLRDLRYPLPDKSDAGNGGGAKNGDGGADAAAGAGAAAAAAFRARLAALVEQLARGRGVDVSAWATAPAPSDPDHQSFCPRCRTEYVVEQGTCRDCGDLPLEPLTPAARPEPRGEPAGHT